MPISPALSMSTLNTMPPSTRWASVVASRSPLMSECKSLELHWNPVSGFSPAIGKKITKRNSSIVFNLIESSKLTVNEKAGKLDQITFIKKPVAKILPIKGLNVKEIEIKGFVWQDYWKPKSKADLFKKDKPEVVAPEPVKKKKA